MKQFTDAIKKSITEKNWFAALFLSLSMPDICGSIETPEESNGSRYQRWFNENFNNINKDPFNRFTGRECWLLRCACLHEGSDKDKSMINKRIHFITPPPNNSTVHRCLFDDVFQMQIDKFCYEMIDAVNVWDMHIVSKNDVMKTRVQNLIKIYGPESLEPYIKFI